MVRGSCPADRRRGAALQRARAIDDGFRLIDMWESRPAFDSFLEMGVLPVLPEVGVANPPEIQFFEFHNCFDGKLSRG